ncbi:purine nucleoside phosphorylase [Drosophila nasuta]|uniref:purine nucleoside phosphorylase n=1 Tax=Drosophila nasuta TaxID=42062 RepID=UPI00295EA4EA|nr:purine nucleoside phosphorylase [Drosophila nasuta]
MCNHDCCAMKTALQLRDLKKMLQKQLQQELENPPKKILTPPSLLYSYENIEMIANFIMSKTRTRPKFGIVCGSHLAMLTKVIEHPIVIDYADIPMFPKCTTQGHRGKLYVGTVRGATVIAMQGRFHYYEGTQLAACSMHVRVMKLCGVEYLFLSCSSSSVNSNHKVGDVLLIKDHVNMFGLFGNSPLNGPHDERFGQRHLAMVNAYDRILLRKAQEIGHEIGNEKHMHTGVYACFGGPAYETVAEQLLLRKLGIDAVGMSQVHEVIVARHCGLRVFAFSLISVPSVENSKFADRSLAPGQQFAKELVVRLIHAIENGLIETPIGTDKLIVSQTGYAEDAFRAPDATLIINRKSEV